MKISFTERELDVMTVLWSRGSATVSEVQASLYDRLAYTTVLTVLRTLEGKGYVSHKGEGRAHRFTPKVKREDAGTSTLRRILTTVFGGSPELLLTNLVNDQNLSPQEIRQLRELLDEHPAAKRRSR